MDISIVIPAYHEQDNVVSRYHELSQVLPPGDNVGDGPVALKDCCQWTQ